MKLKLKLDPSYRNVRIVGCVFILLLFLIGILQYHWYERIAASELAQLKESIINTVRKTSVREFKQYESLFIELSANYALVEPSEEALGQFLMKQLDVYDSTKDEVSLLKGIGYLFPVYDDTGIPLNIIRVTPKGITSDVLTQNEKKLLETFSSIGNNVLPDGLEQDARALPMVWLGAERFALVLEPGNQQKTVIIILDLNLEGFYTDRIIPLANDLFPEYIFTVNDYTLQDTEFLEPPDMEASDLMHTTELSSPPLPPVESDKYFELPEYSFRPLKALFGLSFLETHAFSVPVSWYLTAKGPEGLRRDFFQAEAGTEGGDFQKKMGAFEIVHLSIQIPRGSYTSNIETQLALNWIGGLVLFSLIGIALLFLMVEIISSKKLKIKEMDFIASMTHELRTPLTVITAAADNLSKGIVVHDKVVRYGIAIAENAERLRSMIDKVLAYSRLEGDKPVGIPVIPCDVQLLVKESLDSMQTLAKSQGIRIVADTKGTPQFCMSDPQLLQTILENLVLNAILHAYERCSKRAKDEISESLQITATGNGASLNSEDLSKASAEAQEKVVRVQVVYSIPGTMKICIEDDGCGVPDKDQKHIFEPFYRGERSRENHTQGSGLGLNIVKKSVELLGGGITLTSPYICLNGDYSSGCQFLVSIPCKDVVLSNGHDTRFVHPKQESGDV